MEFHWHQPYFNVQRTKSSKKFLMLFTILLTGIDNDHLNNVAEVLTRLELQGVQFKKSRCTFFSNAVEYLGHKIDAKEIHTAPSITKAIENTLNSRDVQQLTSFLGRLIHYYTKFVDLVTGDS